MNTLRLSYSPSLVGLPLLAALLAFFTIYADTARSIVAIWNSSDTFAHGYIILPISLWLIWRRRDVLANMTPTPYWPALLPLAAAGFGWLLAELGDVQVVRQYAFVAMLPLVALAVLGVRMSKAMAFPLLFLLLAVPFGEIFVDPLINFTADFTVAALQATGIPVLRNGSNFEIPSGSWSVVEACSGVRYLISSFTLGCLYAYLSYRSRARQIVFVLLSIGVPIVANGLRAYMIVMIGHLSGNKLAAGVDHLIYGWAFFGLVMFLMFWIGSFWREDRQATPVSRSQASVRSARRTPSAPQVAAAAISCIACLAVWPMYARFVNLTVFNPAMAQLNSFDALWQESTPFTDWKPSFHPANAEMNRFFRRNAEEVGIAVKFYRNQRHGAELISSANRLVLEKDKSWQLVATSHRRETVGKRELAMREARIHGASGQFIVWYWYWIDGAFTASDYAGKLLQAKEKLLLRGDDSAAVMVFAPYASSPEEARKTMRDYLSQHLAPLEIALAHNKK